MHGSDDLILEKNDGRTVAYLTLKKGAVTYDDTVLGLIPVLCKSLKENTVKSRQLIHLSQKIIADSPRTLKNNDLLLVKTTPLHMRTVFGHVVDELLPSGFSHMSASILQPDTEASGDIYELFGESSLEIHAIPLEFYTLEPFREHVFFSDRDQLQNCIEEKKALFDAFATAPSPIHHKCATFVVKGDQLLSLSEDDWTKQESIQSEYPGIFYPSRQAKMVDKYIKQQPSYPFFDAIEKGTITSEGILLTRYFPSPVMKRHLLSNKIFQHLKGIYFEYPSRSFGDFFSKEDHSLLLDLAQFGIPVFWLDKKTEKILQYVPKSGKDSGMFVPLHEVDRFSNATLFGLYGSNLKEGPFVKLLHDLLKGVLELKSQMNHPLLNPLKPLAMVTGGGPGVMELGNRIARELNYLSCANIVDFSNKTSFVNEQTQNPYIDAKMTYRIDHLVERQSEFHLDFPIFLMGGIGTDFEYALEEVRRKVGSTPPSPILLIGNKSYWEEKISSRFDNNMQNGTTAGSEWISNNFYVIETAKQGLEVYKAFFRNTLPIGKDGPVYPLGFKLMEDSDSWPQSEEK